MVRKPAKEENKAPEGTPGQLYSYFVERCKKMLHIVLCFSPIGEAFRNRVRNFPSLVNCTTIDWFSEWPTDALDSVARRFLSEIEMEEDVRSSCTVMVKLFHESTSREAVEFFKQLKRHYYVTPTSYLEMISTFKTLLKQKREEVLALRSRYENGYDCLIKTESKVTVMQKELEDLKPQLIETSKITEEKMVVVARENAEASKIRDVVAKEEAEAKKVADGVKEIKDECQRDLDEAIPVLKAAEKALNCITRNDISYLRKLPQPPEDAKMVLSGVCVLMGKPPERKLDPQTQKRTEDYWPAAVKMMNEDGFLKALLEYDRETIQEATIKKLRPIVDNEKFNKDHLMNISSVAANLAEWVIAMDKFYHVNLIVVPKKEKLA